MSRDQRRAGIDVSRLAVRTQDPSPEAGFVLIYVRPVAEFGDTNQLCVMYPNGRVSLVGQLTP